LAEAELLDRICTDFENCWRAGEAPQLEQFWEQVPAVWRAHALRELLGVEFELRREAGEQVDLLAWQRRFPGFEDLVTEAATERGDSQFEDWVEAVSQRSGVTARLPPWGLMPQPPDDQGNDPLLVTRERHPVPDAPLPLRFEARRVLGQGGFGTVYLAHDGLHQCLVAVKCIRVERSHDEAARVMLRREAELAASLRHPGIVEIRELLEDDQSLLVIEEFLSGGDLKSKIVPGGLPPDQVVDWMISVAEAVSFAHRHNLFHRDLKPGNILLDERGRPRVSDFGLAVRADDLRNRSAPCRSGTVAYMSPEQVRGETHRIDGRSDTWSLGVVLYELLTGHCPFRGTRAQVLDQIRLNSPRPLRELRPELPVELERICLKCLQRRQADRYTTVADLAEDLRAWRRQQARTAREAIIPEVPAIVPKGLRAFEARDHQFFLELLPGPRDREGLPESLRFWKQVIESPLCDLRLAVGVWHGPSGCGKSSLVRSGLLPCLSPGVVPVMVEAAAHQTEERLLSALRLRVPGLPTTWTLAESLAAVRDGRVAIGGHKLLVVLDQFEQWLQEWSSTPSSGGLLDGLRQCDGQHVQTLLLVRDDFWPPLLRLMERLEVPLQSHRNTVAVELFDAAHARQVLARFGQAYAVLPRDARDFTSQHEAFLDAAIEALADQGRVICVRLALFADLMKSRPWTPAALQTVGGPQGLAVTYLAENLDVDRTPRPRRPHAAAAEQVLRALLPPISSDIRETTLSRRQLQELTGLSGDQRAFTDLLGWLDSDLRLISPTTLAEQMTTKGGDPPAIGPPESGEGMRYQLTHDFLVPAIREWLRSKDLATPEGRARQLLTERTALWEVHPLDRLLPTFAEHVQIRRRTQARDRTAGETRFLRRALQVHLRRGLWGGVATVTLLWLVWLGWGQVQERLLEREVADRVAELKHARPEHWRELIGSLSAPRLTPRIGAHLAGAHHSQDTAETAEESLIPQRLARLLVLGDRTQQAPLSEALLAAEPDVIREVRPALWESGGESLREPLWTEAQNLREPSGSTLGGPTRDSPRAERSFRAAVLLSGCTADDPRWSDLAPALIRHLASLSSDEVLEWRTLLQPIRRSLVPSLLRTFQQGAPNSTDRRFALECLVDFARDDADTLAEALLAADPESFDRLLPAARHQREAVCTRLWSELAGSSAPVGRWNDPADQTTWPAPAKEIVTELTRLGGAVHDSFAFCLKIPVNRLLPICEALRPAGYRPLHIHSNTADRPTGVVSVVWVRDQWDWTLLDSMTVQGAVEEDIRQASRGHEVNALLNCGPGKTTVLWGPPGAWGRQRKWVVGPRGRLDLRVVSLPTIPRTEGRWRVRFHQIPSESWNDPDPDFKQISQAPPLFEGYFPMLEIALGSVRAKFNGIPRNLLCIAECDVDATQEVLFLETHLVDGWRVAWDGAQIACHRELGDHPIHDATTPVRVSTGRHTLRLELWWKELFSVSACRFGTSIVSSHTELQTLAPEWMLDSRVPVEPESPVSPLEPTFDLASVPITDQTATSTELDRFLGQDFRPFRILHDSPGSIRVDLCRPRPSPDEIDHWAARRAKGVLALLELKSPTDARDPWNDALLPNLEMQVDPRDPNLLDPTMPTELMRHLAQYRMPSSSPWSRLRPERSNEVPTEARRQLWLSLGLAGLRMSPDARANWIQTLDLHRHWANERDAGIHAALDWIRRHWELKLPAPVPLSSSPVSLPTPAPGERPTWVMNPQGQTLSLFPAGTFWKGSWDPRFEFQGSQGRHLETIDRPFALAAFCVTAPEFQRFRRASQGVPRDWQRVTPFPEHANWIDAVLYLNWLSAQEGLQPCYEFSERGEVIIPADCLDRDGYRLPTSAEWEYAARAGGGTDWIHGSTPTHLGDFAMLAEKNREIVWLSSVGRKLPNPTGLFDMHGNGQEWTHDGPAENRLPGQPPGGHQPHSQQKEQQILAQQSVRWLRSGSSTATADGQRIHFVGSHTIATDIGSIRPARTLRPHSSPETVKVSR
jgi:serine/threonine protein kinase/formylglycine-generating enzyme required for sulfatase activity